MWPSSPSKCRGYCSNVNAEACVSPELRLGGVLAGISRLSGTCRGGRAVSSCDVVQYVASFLTGNLIRPLPNGQGIGDGCRPLL
jgi:hypothetical protein